MWLYLYLGPQFCAATYPFTFLSFRAYFTLENMQDTWNTEQCNLDKRNVAPT